MNCGAIRRTALLTVEGERDDICAVGQTVAAQDLCTGIRPYMKTHHIQTGVGHYGVFSGRKWNAADLPAGARDDSRGGATDWAARPMPAPRRPAATPGKRGRDQAAPARSPPGQSRM